jgi:hypothetical protein
MRGTWILGAAVAVSVAGCQSDWTIASDVTDVAADAFDGDVDDVGDVGGEPGPSVVVRGIEVPKDLKVDHGTVFWLTIEGVWSMPVAGGQAALVPVSAGGRAFVVDADFLYWDGFDGNLNRTSRTWDGTVVVAVETGGARDLVLSGDFLYWSTGSRVMRVAKDANRAVPEAVSESLPEWGFGGLVVDDDSVFTQVGGAVYRAGRAGSEGWTLVVPDAGLTENHLYSDGTDLFLLSSSEMLVRKAHKDGSDMQVFQSGRDVQDMAFDGEFAYLAGGYSCVSRKSLQTSQVQGLDFHRYGCFGVAVDDAWVYWAEWLESPGKYAIYRAPLTSFQ